MSRHFDLIVANHQKRAVEQGLMEIGFLVKQEPAFEILFPEDMSLNKLSRSTTVESISSRESSIDSPKTLARLESVVDRVDNRIYQVQFKHGFRYCSNRSGQILSIGDFVVLDFTHDQVDVGVLTRHYSWEHFEAKRAKAGKFVDEDETKVYEIIRTATTQECEYLPFKYEQEQRLLKICQHLAVEVFCLSMNIYGVEFQFDGKKVSVYYTSGTRVDYKNLVKEIYKHCKIHVWMRKTNRCSKFIPLPFATAALMTGVSQH